MITGVALFLILHSVSLSIVPSLFAGANLVYIGLAVAVTLLIRVLMALKWKLLFHYSGITLPLRYNETESSRISKHPRSSALWTA